MSKKFHVPFVANTTKNEAWQFPFSVISDYTNDEMFKKLNGVSNITDIDLTMTGSLQHNLPSDLLNGGFEFKFNELFNEQTRKADAGCFDDQPIYYSRAGLDIDVEAKASYIRGDFSLILRDYPFPFAIKKFYLYVWV